MSNAKVFPDVMKAVLGHANPDVADGYGIGPALQVKNEEVRKVIYPGLGIIAISKNFWRSMRLNSTPRVRRPGQLSDNI